MTNIYIDTETRGLNCQKWEMGVIVHEDGRAEHFNQRTGMINRIQELEERHRRKGTTLLIYAHNMSWDWHVLYWDKETDHNIYCNRPFIADRKDEEGRIYSKYLDTLGFYKGPLEDIATVVGMKKGKTPEYLIEGRHGTFMEQNEAHTYMEMDAQILRTFIQEKLQRALDLNNITTRHLITGSQISINAIMKELRGSELLANDWQLYKTYYQDKHHEALRGGRVQALQTGTHKHCTYIDINSSYPHELINMEMPDLKTGTHVSETLLKRHWTQEQILNTTGIMSCEITIEKEHIIGILPIRTEESTVWPYKKGTTLRGTWTTKEVAYAISKGYKLKKTHWLIHYDTLEVNPLKEYFERLYKEKQKATDKFDKYFIKLLMNGGIGKFSQRREKLDYKWVEWTDHLYMLENGYEAIDVQGNKRLYVRNEGYNYPRYYAPIINILITAQARINITEDLLSFQPGQLLYVDTDAIIYKGPTPERIKYKKGKNHGEYKVEHKNSTCHIWGRKTYLISDQPRISGVPKRQQNITPDDDTVTFSVLRTKAATIAPEEVGTMATHTRYLSDTTEKHTAEEQELMKATMWEDSKHVAWRQQTEYTQQSRQS